MQLPRQFKNNLRQFEAIWGNLRQCEVGPSRALPFLSGNLSQFKTIWGNLRQFKTIWAIALGEEMLGRDVGEETAWPRSWGRDVGEEMLGKRCGEEMLGKRSWGRDVGEEMFGKRCLRQFKTIWPLYPIALGEEMLGKRRMSLSPLYPIALGAWFGLACLVWPWFTLI